MAWLITTDVIYAAKGQVPPRKQVRLAEIEAGTVQRRYGVGGWFRDLADDALKAHTAHRRDKAARRAEQRKAERKAAKKQAKRAAAEVDPVEVDPAEPAGPAAVAVPTDRGPGAVYGRAAVPTADRPVPATAATRTQD